MKYGRISGSDEDFASDSDWSAWCNWDESSVSEDSDVFPDSGDGCCGRTWDVLAVWSEVDAVASVEGEDCEGCSPDDYV